MDEDPGQTWTQHSWRSGLDGDPGWGMVPSSRGPRWRGRPALGTAELYKRQVPGDSSGEAGGGWSWGGLSQWQDCAPQRGLGVLGLGVQDPSWGDQEPSWGYRFWGAGGAGLLLGCGSLRCWVWGCKTPPGGLGPLQRLWVSGVLGLEAQDPSRRTRMLSGVPTLRGAEPGGAGDPLGGPGPFLGCRSQGCWVWGCRTPS